MKLTRGNPLWVALFFFLTLGLAFRYARPQATRAASQPQGRTPLVLQPKAELRSEPGSWTFAPDVPPPIHRKEQKRVVVHREIKETQAEIAPGIIYDDYWGFEGRVPGPLLRVREGDLVEIFNLLIPVSGASMSADADMGMA